MQKSFSVQGITLVGISADEPEDSADFARRTGIEFPLLSDADLTIANAFGVANANEETAVPAVFVIDRQGLIRWRDVGASLADRVTPSRMLKEALAVK